MMIRLFYFFIFLLHFAGMESSLAFFEEMFGSDLFCEEFCWMSRNDHIFCEPKNGHLAVILKGFLNIGRDLLLNLKNVKSLFAVCTVFAFLVACNECLSLFLM